MLVLSVFLAKESLFSQENIPELKVESNPKNVTVFLTGAELSHTNQVSLKKGKNLLKFIGLSSKMDEGSIVVDLENKSLVILSVYSHNNFLTRAESSPVIKSLKDTIEKIEEVHASVTGKIDSYNKEKDLLFKSSTSSTNENNVKLIQEYGDFCRNRQNQINEQVYKLSKSEKFLKNKLDMLNKQLDELNANLSISTTEISVLVSAANEISSGVELKYRVADAGWAPKYDLRVEGIAKPVNLYYRANIYNNTGIDWKDVKLKLSTANPSQGAQFPELETWNLKEADENKISYKQAQEKISQLKKENKEVEFETVAVDELSAEFIIEQPYTILSDRRPYLVDVNNRQLEAKYEYISVPKMDKDAFLTAKVVGWADLSLVSGSASVFYNGTYIGQSSIDIQEVSDTLTLSLGRDNRIAITRIKKSELNDHQILGNYQKEMFKYEIVVKNNREIPVSINLKDQVPMANDSRININFAQLSDGKYDKYSGDVNWMLKLAPGETKTLAFNFSTKYPKEFNDSVRRKSSFYRSNYQWLGTKNRRYFRAAPKF